MAEIYKVCVDGQAVNASITLSNGTCPASTINYQEGGCNIFEKWKTLTFTSNTPADNNYRIFYSVTVTYYTNYDQDGSPVIQWGFITMPEGATIVTKQVLCDRWSWCTDEDYEVVRDRDALPDQL